MKRNRKKSKLILMVLVGVIALGIGYAAISSVNLNIGGQAKAKSDGVQDDFKVAFKEFSNADDAIIIGNGENINSSSSVLSLENTKAENTYNDISVEASVDGTSANFSIQNLADVKDFVKIKFIAKNSSADLAANIKLKEITNSNDEYFDISATVDNAESKLVGPGEEVVVTAIINVKKIPTLKDATGNFNIVIEAEPKEV